MKLAKLFKRRSDGGVQEWSIEVKDECFRVTSGIKDGSLVTSEWTVCEGKNIGRSNETDPATQASLEAKAKWQKQYDKGYREDVGEVDNLEQFKPMLAKQWEDYRDKISFPLYAQPKLDGMRCIVRKDGMWSRNGKKIVSAPHIFKALAPLFAKIPDLIFDGELYADKFKSDFNTIIHLAKQTKPTAEDLAESAEHLQYHVYDLPSTKSRFAARSLTLKALIQGLKNPSIVFVQTEVIPNQAALDNLYEKWLDEGYEGQIIRVDAKYENKRTSSLLKRKEFLDEEFAIVDIVEGVGNKSGMAGFAKFTRKGKEFKANVMGDRDYCRNLLKNKKSYIGKKATVRYTNLTPDGIPRFPRMKCMRDYE